MLAFTYEMFTNRVGGARGGVFQEDQWKLQRLSIVLFLQESLWIFSRLHSTGQPKDIKIEDLQKKKTTTRTRFVMKVRPYSSKRGIKTHASTHAYTHKRARSRAHTHARTHANTHTHVRTRTHAHTHTHARAPTHTRTYAHTRARTHTHTHACTHTSIY